jgi:hypothetical protein
MDDKEIQSVLQDVLEEEIPASQIHLWPAVKANLLAGKRQTRFQGEKMNTTKKLRMPRFAIAILLIVVLLGIILMTPPGRSFAQSVLQFFMPADSTSFPLSSSPIVESESDPAAPTALPPSALISVAEAEAQVGFDVAELPSVPEGFDYLGARLYGHAVNIEYDAKGGGGHLVIQQSKDGYNQSDWDKVPADAIIPVEIDGLKGAYVQGIFVVYPGETAATWNGDAPVLRLRWVDDGTWFEITKYGDVEVIEYLDQTALIKLAESLSVQP